MERKCDMKRFICLLIASLLLVATFCSCATETNDKEVVISSDENAKTSLKPLVVLYPAWNDDMTATSSIFINAAKIFTERYGIEVELYPSPYYYELLESGDVMSMIYDYRTKLTTEIMAGRGPDVYIDTTALAATIFNDLHKKMDNGLFCDLNDFITNDNDFKLDDYEKTILDTGIYKGKRYLMPLSYKVPLYLTTEEKLERFGFTTDDF